MGVVGWVGMDDATSAKIVYRAFIWLPAESPACKVLFFSKILSRVVEYSFFCAARVVGDSKEYDVDVLVLELVLVFELVDVLELV